MRTFEIILLLSVTLLPFVKRPVLRRVQANHILIFLGVLLSLHLVIEGWRWQMIPAYILVLILAWRIKALDASETVRLNFLRGVGFFGIVALALVAWVLPMALPVFTLPEPTGSYSVGTEMVHLQTDKDETITKDPNDKRELMLKVWYPSDADVSSLDAEKYAADASRAGFATKYGLPAGALNYLDRVETFAYPGIPASDKMFPVLIFSHGYGSRAQGYYALLSEIASQGYVIVNMNHSYESLGITLPDGSEKYFDYDYQREIADGSMEVVQPLIDAFKEGQSYEQRHPIVRRASLDYFEGRVQDRWAEDMRVALNQLESWNAEGPLKGKLDLDKIGVFGHSVGGGSAGNLAMKDNRIKAAVNLDGIQWGEKIDTTSSIPYLYVSADWPAEHEDINSHVYQKKSTDYFYETKLLQSGHPNFMDIPFMIPVQSLAGTGEIDPYQGNEIVTQLVTSFFDRHLKGLQDADPRDVADQYALLEMNIYEGDSIK
jgi:predicted dienelactone hydrolase